jgi:hypothetical protein
VPPVVVRARAPPRAPSFDPVDSATGVAHQVADELAAAELSPDHAGARSGRLVRQDARRPLAPRAESRRAAATRASSTAARSANSWSKLCLLKAYLLGPGLGRDQRRQAIYTSYLFVRAQ